MEEDLFGVKCFQQEAAANVTSLGPQHGLLLLLSTLNPPLLQLLFLNNGPFGIFQSHHGSFLG